MKNQKSVFGILTALAFIGLTEAATYDTKTTTSYASKAEVDALRSQVATLQAQVSALMNVVRISGNDATIQTPGELRIEPREKLFIKSGHNIDIRTPLNIYIKPGNELTLQPAADLKLYSGRYVKLNSGVNATQGYSIINYDPIDARVGINAHNRCNNCLPLP